jgi:hypothetical protein
MFSYNIRKVSLKDTKQTTNKTKNKSDDKNIKRLALLN